jgi:hypothetical protein
MPLPLRWSAAVQASVASAVAFGLLGLDVEGPIWLVVLLAVGNAILGVVAWPFPVCVRYDGVPAATALALGTSTFTLRYAAAANHRLVRRLADHGGQE